MRGRHVRCCGPRVGGLTLLEAHLPSSIASRRASPPSIRRDGIAPDRSARVAAALDGHDAELRASLIGACMMGLALTRYVMSVEPLASASRDDVERLFEPVLRRLVEPPP